MRNKIGISLLLCFIFSPPILNAESVVDFDGRSKELESVTTQLKDNANNYVVTSAKETIVPSASEQSHRLRAEFGILSDSGEWETAQSTWTKETVFVETPPGSYLLFDLFCQNNTQYNWSFRASFTMETWKKQITSPGHSHYNVVPPPPLTYDNGGIVPNPLIVKNIPPGVHHKLTLKMPAFATQITIKVKLNSTGGCANQDISGLVYVKEKTKLGTMPEGDTSVGYLLLQPPLKSPHPSVHNVTNDFKVALKKLGATWRETCPRSNPLLYQRMSLPWGGVFDMNLDWKEPYYGHAKGAAVDISKRDIRKGNRQGFINLLCKDFKVYSEQDNDPSHYHTLPRKGESNINWPGAVACCIKESGQYPSPKTCIDLTQADELYPVISDCPYLPDYQDPNYTFR